MLLFQDIMGVGDFNFNNILLDENSYGGILVYDISYKTFMGAKGLRVRFHQVNGLLKFMIVVLHEFYLQHFLNKPYPNVKIILAYSYIVKTI